MDLALEHVIRESDHRIHNAFTPEKLARLGAVLRLAPGSWLLDLCSGSGEMLCTWARDHDIGGVGVDLSTVFTDAALARAVELGVDDRVRFEHGDAAAYRPEAGEALFDVVSCVGATWIGDGVLGTIELMERHLRPGGTLLVGEPFWLRRPETEEAIRGSHATSIEDFATLPGLVASFAAHDWDLVQMVLADQDDWDHYAAAQWATTRRWLDANPGHELWQQMRDELDGAPLAHVTYTRDYLGWGVFALRRR